MVYYINKHLHFYTYYVAKFVMLFFTILDLIIIIISDVVDDRDQKHRYVIEVVSYRIVVELLKLSRYQPALGNERINTKMNK